MTRTVNDARGYKDESQTTPSGKFVAKSGFTPPKMCISGATVRRYLLIIPQSAQKGINCYAFHLGWNFWALKISNYRAGTG
jgi:hypothetical protein